MLKLVTTNTEMVSQAITIAVDVEFEKNGTTHEANVTCIYNEDMNIGYSDWECLIANVGEVVSSSGTQKTLPDLTIEEENEILEHAKKYAEKLVG